jgi:hypothetical protein
MLFRWSLRSKSTQEDPLKSEFHLMEDSHQVEMLSSRAF